MNAVPNDVQAAGKKLLELLYIVGRKVRLNSGQFVPESARGMLGPVGLGKFQQELDLPAFMPAALRGGRHEFGLVLRLCCWLSGRCRLAAAGLLQVLLSNWPPGGRASIPAGHALPRQETVDSQWLSTAQKRRPPGVRRRLHSWEQVRLFFLFNGTIGVFMFHMECNVQLYCKATLVVQPS